MLLNNTSKKRLTFKSLHESGCFLLPNPWDIGSAKLLASLGFKALATTSSGYAWSQGIPDGKVGLEESLNHMKKMAMATELPINADFGNGFASTPDKVARNVQLAIDTGVASISIEDSTGNASHPLRAIRNAAEIIYSARKTIDLSGEDMLLIGRAENFLVGKNDLEDTIIRLKTYASAGADCLYAPGIKTREQITEVVNAVSPKPVNVLIGWNSDLTMQELGELGVRRISVGGAFSKVAIGAMLHSAITAITLGRFDTFSQNPSSNELNTFFSKDNEK